MSDKNSENTNLVLTFEILFDPLKSEVTFAESLNYCRN